MNSEIWWTALSTTGLIGAALWLGRNLILTRLTKSVQHEFDVRIEEVRAGLRETEERLRAELRIKESEISALRGVALSALASRQAALDRRKLEAVDQLWSAVEALSPGRSLVSALAVIKFEPAAAIAMENPQLREMFKMMGGKFNLAAIDLSNAGKARPFVSPMAWAIYTAMIAVITHTAIRLEVLKSGIGSRDFIDEKAVNALVSSALPDLATTINEHGPLVYPQVLAALEARLMTEFQAMMTGADTDKAGVEQAAEILRRATALMADSKTSSTE